MVVSTAERWPTSAEIACRKRSSLSATRLRAPARPAARHVRAPLRSATARPWPGRPPPAPAAGRSSGICPWRSSLKGAFQPYHVAARWPFVELLARAQGTQWKSVHPAVIKSKKTFPQPFPKAARLDTYAPHPTGFAPGCLPRKPLGRTRKATRTAPASTDRPRDLIEGAQLFNAGWSSPVARQAHNLKVIGSNPIPATKFGFRRIRYENGPRKAGHFCFGIVVEMSCAARGPRRCAQASCELSNKSAWRAVIPGPLRVERSLPLQLLSAQL